MSTSRNLKLLLLLIVLPLIGMALGYGLAYTRYFGLLVDWELAGAPGEPVADFLGLTAGRQLLVEGQSGQLHALDFLQAEQVRQPSEWTWAPAAAGTDFSARQRSYGARFRARPPGFPVRDSFQFEYFYKVEGLAQVRFTLDPDGRLWLWHHQVSGLDGLVFFFGPVFGTAAGFVAAWLVIAYYWRKGRREHQPPPVDRQAF
jgi:hypothetical protein